MQAIPSALLLVFVTLATSACYLTHVAAGQFRLLRARRPIAEMLRDPATPADVRQPLALVGEVRDFAERLGLDVDGQYTSFVAWPGDRVATVIVTAHPGELSPAGFHYPIVGTLPYKGFFDAERAEAEATRLRAEGLDVCISGVPAYSTLGWLEDPVTGPMLRRSEGELAETILHELVHATVFVRDDPDLSEGVASFIGQEGVVRFYLERGQTARAAEERARIEEDRRLTGALAAFRERVIALNEELPPGPARDAARAEAEASVRREIAAMEFANRDAAATAEELRLNDACLAWYGTYWADTPRYEALFETLDGDLGALVARLREASESDDPRAALLGP